MALRLHNWTTVPVRIISSIVQALALIAWGKLRGWMCYSLRHCLYSKTESSDLSTVLPLTETSAGKPPCLSHSAHVLLSRAEQLKSALSFPVSAALPNQAWLEVSSPFQPGPHRRSSRNSAKQSRSLKPLLICFRHYDPRLSLTALLTVAINTNNSSIILVF